MKRIERLLTLGRRGVLILVREAVMPHFRALAERLKRIDPHLYIARSAPRVELLAPGTLVLLKVREKDAEWLNIKRPVFHDRALRVVLWAAPGEMEKLRRLAPDFFDWISHVIDGPRPPLRALLPPLPRVFGREREIDDVVERMLAGRPTALVGLPGIGKSTIALAALHDARVAEKYRDRRAFVRCAGVLDRTTLAGAIVHALQLPATADPEASLWPSLRLVPAAVVFDGLDEMPPDAARRPIEELIAELAKLPGSAAITQRPGAPPDGVAWETLAIEPSESAAISLFERLAGTKFRGDPRLPKLLAAAGHMPLAVSLIAGVARTSSDLEALRVRFDAGPETSVAAAIDAAATTPATRRLLSALSLLPAGMALADAEALFGQDARRAAEKLKEANLVVEIAERLQMHPLVRARAAETRPSSAGDRELIIEHYVALTKQVHGLGWQSRTTLERISAEVANLERCLLLALDGPGSPFASAAIAYGRIVVSVGSGSILPIERALAGATARGDASLKAALTISLAEIASMRSNQTEAIYRFEEALSLARLTGNLGHEAKCLMGLGQVARVRSKLDEARDKYEQALMLLEKTEDIHGRATCLGQLGEIAFQRSDYDAAARSFEDAMALFRRVGERTSEAMCLIGLGRIALERSDLGVAETKLDLALSLCRATGVAQGEAHSTFFLARAAAARSDYELARSRSEAAMLLYRRVNDLLGEANCLRALGDFAGARSDRDGARMHYEDALVLYRRAGYAKLEAVTLAALECVSAGGGSA